MPLFDHSATGPLPDCSQAALDTAFVRFDLLWRDTTRYDGFPTSGNFKFAIERDGKLYPPKAIVALATARDPSTFSGGDQTARWLRKHGIEQVPLRRP